MEEIKANVRKFLGRYFKDRVVGDEDDIFASGLVNSLAALELVTFLEKEYKLTLSNEDLVLTNFCSVGAISRFTERKLEELQGK